MSRENVELLRSAHEAMMRRDYNAVSEFAHPDIEWETGLPGTSTYRGREGVRRMFQDVDKAWEEWRMEPLNYIEGDDVVVIEARFVARGRTSGATVEADQVSAMEFADGLVRRVRVFTERTEALEAVGLRE
jgi:uncharacterized protein